MDSDIWIARPLESKDPELPVGSKVIGEAFELLCETEDPTRVIQIRGRLYKPGTGHFQIFTILAGADISPADHRFYIKQKELIENEREEAEKKGYQD